MINKGVRLNNRDIEAIKRLFLQYFSVNDHLWLFGSRADVNKKGGDIDLYIETTELNTKEAVKKESQFVLALERAIGEQKIDIVLNVVAHRCCLPIYKIAKETGVLLI